MKEYKVVGVMSGSSLDGLDVCLISLQFKKKWSFSIIKAANIGFHGPLKEKLKHADELKGYDLYSLDAEYGTWIGQQLAQFLSGERDVDVVGVHGHTVFHEPEHKISLQIGSGPIISHVTQLPVVDHFRINDILEGGQGAPLVPMGDVSLFPEYDAWVNLGGIANITIKKDDGVIAWDIAPCNQVFNTLAGFRGLPFDRDGELARNGSLIDPWLIDLGQLHYFKMDPPKSLSNQWGRKNILNALPVSIEDGLHSYAYFLAAKMTDTFEKYLDPEAVILITGGGAKNKYLMELLQQLQEGQFKVTIPDQEIIDFKEAIIFGFLGLLRMLNKENVLGSATGARTNTVSGNIHMP